WWRRLLLAACLGLLLAVGVLIVLPRLGQPSPTEHTPGAALVEPIELHRENIPPRLLALAGGGDPAKAPPELAAVLGDGRYLFPRLGQTAWLQQSPDGQVLAVPLDEDVMLFEVPSGKYLRDLKGPGGRVFNVTFSSDGQLLGATTRFEGAGGL